MTVLTAIFDSVLRDVRFALRGLRGDPGFTVVAVAALAVGLAANTAVFTVVNAVFFKNLPFAGSERIVYVLSPNVHDMSSSDALASYPDYADFHDRAKSFEVLVAARMIGVNLSDQTAFAERYGAMQMTINGFSAIRQKPVLGRDFMPGDERPDGELVAILTDRLWEVRYGRSPNVLGTTIRVDGNRATVVGVMGPEVKFAGDSDLFLPIRPALSVADGQAAPFYTRRDRRQLMVFGRLADGVSLARANTELRTIARQLAAAYPDTNKDVGARVVTYSEATFNGRIKLLVLAVQGAVICVLLIACSNVAYLLVARALKRARELSIRLALGAGRARLVRQLLVESVLLAAICGALGWALALVGIRALIAAIPPDQMPSTLDISIDRTVFVFLAAITVATGLLFGVMPAFRASNTDVQSALSATSHTAVGGGRRSRLTSNVLVATAVALTTVLLVGTGLTVRSLLYVRGLRLGINSSNVLTMRIELAGAKYGQPEAQTAFYDRLTATLDALPGVERSSIATTLPANGWMRSGAIAYQYQVEGTSEVDPKRLPRTPGAAIGPAFFHVLQARLINGRELTAADDDRSDRVLIVNQSFAARAWPSGDPIGRRVRFVGEGGPAGWARVVGVVADVLDNDFSPGQPFVYVPFAQLPVRGMSVIARTNVPPETLVAAFRRTVQTIDPDLPVRGVETLDSRIARSRLDVYLFTRVFVIFGAIALVLACTGLYAVLAHLVTQRSPELALRVAVGARSPDIVRLVFASGMRPVLVGLVPGLALSQALTWALRSVLAGISSTDVITLTTVALLLAAAGLLGCAVPARRALRINPNAMLRVQ